MTDSDALDDAKPPQWNMLPAEIRRDIILEALRSDPEAFKKLRLVARTEQTMVNKIIESIENAFRQPFQTQSRNEARGLIADIESRYGKKFIESLVKTKEALRDKTAALRRRPKLNDRHKAAEDDLMEQLDRIENRRPPTMTTEKLRQVHKATGDEAFDAAYDEMVIDTWEHHQNGRAGDAAAGVYSLTAERALRRLFDSPAVRELEQARNEEFKPLAEMLTTGTRSEALAKAQAFMDEGEDEFIASIPPHLAARLWALEQYEWLENRLDAAKAHLVEGGHSASEGGHSASEVGYLHAINGTKEFHRVVEEWFDTYMRDAKAYLRSELGTPEGRELTKEDVRYVRASFDLPSIRTRLDSMLADAPSSGGFGSALYRRDLQETAWARHSGDPRTEENMPPPRRSFAIVLEHERPTQERAEEEARGRKRALSEGELPPMRKTDDG